MRIISFSLKILGVQRCLFFIVGRFRDALLPISLYPGLLGLGYQGHPRCHNFVDNVKILCRNVKKKHLALIETEGLTGPICSFLFLNPFPSILAKTGYLSGNNIHIISLLTLFFL